MGTGYTKQRLCATCYVCLCTLYAHVDPGNVVGPASHPSIPPPIPLRYLVLDKVQQVHGVWGLLLCCLTPDEPRSNLKRPKATYYIYSGPLQRDEHICRVQRCGSERERERASTQPTTSSAYKSLSWSVTPSFNQLRRRPLGAESLLEDKHPLLAQPVWSHSCAEHDKCVSAAKWTRARTCSQAKLTRGPWVCV